jgi:hypothetical protein
MVNVTCNSHVINLITSNKGTRSVLLAVVPRWYSDCPEEGIRDSILLHLPVQPFPYSLLHVECGHDPERSVELWDFSSPSQA